MKVCVIVASYHRKNGTSKEKLNKMLRNLELQTYTDFKLFLIGDHYDNNEEFEELCRSYNKDIFYINNDKHYRNFNFSNKQNYWSIGGGLAIKTGIEKAIEENYDYYFHLDDDDTWANNHIEIVTDHIKQYPLAGFILTKGKYLSKHLPNTNENNVFYNNYIPRCGDSVHASHIYKLNTLGPVILNHIENIDTIANQINNKEISEILFEPGDSVTLGLINKLTNDNVIKSLYIPIVTVFKDSDGNFPV